MPIEVIADQRNDAPKPSQHDCQAIKQRVLDLLRTVKPRFTKGGIYTTMPHAFLGADIQHDILSNQSSLRGDTIELIPLAADHCEPVEESSHQTTFLLIPEHCTRSDNSMPSEGPSNLAFYVAVQRSKSTSANILVDRCLFLLHGSASYSISMAASVLLPLMAYAAFRSSRLQRIRNTLNRDKWLVPFTTTVLHRYLTAAKDALKWDQQCRAVSTSARSTTSHVGTDSTRADNDDRVSIGSSKEKAMSRTFMFVG